uniref:Protein kinase domain-containing protein n=1 Tax=Amphiprion percula TaxID=161767 RepID=A0A3P8RVJ3_AMPPE
MNVWPETCLDQCWSGSLLLYEVSWTLCTFFIVPCFSVGKVSYVLKTLSMAKKLGIKKGSRLGRYHVVEDILGEGGYGIVAKCRNTGTTKIEAVKVNKSEKGVLEVAMNEIAILNRLRRLNPDTCNIVQCNGFFYDKENICISFELLDLSLQDYLQEKNPRGLTTRELRPILHQLATALSHLHSSGIIHADLKPANVMVVNRHEQPPKVKLIDFGLARLVSAVIQGEWMGTLHYSAPELLLGVPFNESVDMWALGLLMVKLATGCQLYPGKTGYDVLRFIFEMQGQPCDDVLDRGCYTPYFFFNPGYEEDQKIFVTQEVLKHRFFAPSLYQNSTDFNARSPVPPLSAASWEERVDNNHQNPASWQSAASWEERVDFSHQHPASWQSAPSWEERVDLNDQSPAPCQSAGEVCIEIPHETNTDIGWFNQVRLHAQSAGASV